MNISGTGVIGSGLFMLSLYVPGVLGWFVIGTGWLFVLFELWYMFFRRCL
jgi:hypothetical protein